MNELTLHFQVAKLLREHCKWLWTHIASGEKRDPRTAAKLKQMGVQRGWPDFIFISPEAKAYCLELKRATGSLSPHQRIFRNYCDQYEVPYEVAHNFRDATDILMGWGCLDVISNASK